MRIIFIHNVNDKLLSSSAYYSRLHQMNICEIEVRIQSDRVGTEQGNIIDFYRNSGNCSVIVRDLPPEPY